MHLYIYTSINTPYRSIHYAPYTSISFHTTYSTYTSISFHTYIHQYINTSIHQYIYTSILLYNLNI